MVLSICLKRQRLNRLFRKALIHGVNSLINLLQNYIGFGQLLNFFARKLLIWKAATPCMKEITICMLQKLKSMSPWHRRYFLINRNR
jgi:hypothetical protein